MLSPAVLPTPLTVLVDERLARLGVELRLKRDDLAHPTVPGNKWRKLAPNLADAVAQGRTGLLTFGGAYSTHVRATAAAAAELGLASIGVIRGDELAGRPRNWSLRAAEAAGMELRFVSRARYRSLVAGPADGPADGTADDAAQCPEQRDGRWLVLPEGGSNAAAVRGAAAVPGEIPGLGERDVLCCPVGTGGTLAGIAAGLPPGARALGVAVLRGEGYLEREVAGLHQAAYGRQFANWRIDHGHHGGGYGRVSPELTAFAAEFERVNGLAPELRYVAKTLLAVHELAAAGEFAPGTRLTVVVTGLPDPQP